MRWFESLVRKAGLRRWSGVIAGVIMLAMSGHAWAAMCTGGGQSYTLPMPTSVMVPRDAPVGTALSNWVGSPQVTNWYNCSQQLLGLQTPTGVGFETLSLTDSGVRYSVGGITYTVWNTNVPGVGIAIAAQAYLSGCNGWQPLADISNATAGCNPLVGTGTHGGYASVILVKTGPVTGGTTSGGILFDAASYLTPGVYQAGMRVSFSLSPTAFVAASCSTPSVTVSMGSYPASTFTGVGSTSRRVGFNVAINNCPAGLNSIQYQFDAPGGVTDYSKGLIALTSSSTAKGIGLQLIDPSTNILLSIGASNLYQLSSYNTAKGGSFTIPLTANYYQTVKTVTPGTANAILTFTMTYQ